MVSPSVDIVILNWNSFDDTKACIESLQKIKYPNFNILLVDNASSKNEISDLKKLIKKSSNCSLILNKKNEGFAGGCNVGIKKSLNRKSDYILLLNNDTEVDSHFLSEMVKTAENNPGIGIVGSKIFYFDEPERIWVAGIKFNFYFPPLSKGFDATKPTEVNGVVGTSMLIKTNVIKKIGMLDEEYFAYGEEDDFNFRALKAGYKLVYCPDSILWHKVSSSTGGGFNPTVAYYKMRNKIKYAKKNYPLKYWPSYFIFLILYFLKSQIKAILGGHFNVSKSLLKGVFDS